MLWLLILAILLLSFSSLLSAYYVSCLSVKNYERPPAFWRHEKFLIYGNIIFLVAGFIMLFIAVDWKWGLAGIAIYWLLVVFVGIPIANRVRRGRVPGLRG